MSQTLLSDAELLSLNQQGLIPGPNETESEFIKRANYCLNLKNILASELGLPQPVDSEIAKKLIQDASPITKQLFNISTEWAPIIFSNHKLALWHGGCAWIFQQSEETPTAAFFQLRRVYETSTRYLGIYDRQELIAHESAHVGRMLFQEPKFEEMLAYTTGRSLFRRMFGPIIESPWEVVLFALALLFSFAADFSAAIFGGYQLYNVALWLKVPPLIIIGCGLVRLWIRHQQFSRCLKKLQGMFGNEKANWIIYRLTDKEILALGKMNVKDITHYISSQKESSLRWRLLNLAYTRLSEFEKDK